VPPDAVSSLAWLLHAAAIPDALTVRTRCGYGQVRTAFDEDAASATGRTRLKVGPVLITAVRFALRPWECYYDPLPLWLMC
jgi:hypothetical protein